MSLLTTREPLMLSPGCDNPFRRLIGRGNAVHRGVMVSPREQVTAQQYDLQFGTNVIGKSSSNTHS